MHIYYHKGVITQDFELNEAESHHAVKVMRTQVGASIRVVNGEGQESVCELLDNHPKHCRLKVISTHFEAKKTKKIVIAIAPTKTNERIEWFLEKATEIGVDEIIPLVCKNGERAKINYDRWEKTVIAAVKQSKRKWKPLIYEAQSMGELVKMNFGGHKLIAYCEQLPDKKITDFTDGTSTLLLIGPEGDFTLDEVRLAQENQFVAISLGDNRLRTETAGVVGVTVLCLGT